MKVKGEKLCLSVIWSVLSSALVPSPSLSLTLCPLQNVPNLSLLRTNGTVVWSDRQTTWEKEEWCGSELAILVVVGKGEGEGRIGLSDPRCHLILCMGVLLSLPSVSFTLFSFQVSGGHSTSFLSLSLSLPVSSLSLCLSSLFPSPNSFDNPSWNGRLLLVE